jgi:hypothetical protein
VDQVAEFGLLVAEHVGGPVGFLGMRRGFHGVDQQMVRERVLRFEREDGLEGRDELLRVGLWLPVRRRGLADSRVGRRRRVPRGLPLASA